MTSDQKITFRDIQTQDEQFLRLVYRSTREDELAVVPWNDAQKDHFLRFQFDAQHADYIKNYPNAQFLIIEADGAGIGRLYVDRTESEIHILDIALVQSARGKGIGGSILNDFIAESRTTGKAVRIYVENYNPALRLYQRLGFKQVAKGEVYLEMLWKP